jgi:glucosamine--fructose-6-phosphate aminotransferase (isomerizing)
MCGILGYVSDDTELSFEECLLMLKSLEYRGYDSWGLSYKKNNNINLIKEVGKIPLLDNKDKSNLFLGHTRWATHGGVTKENAHPHLSMNGRVTLIHNGIIENYEDIKTKLIGYNYKGQTDSEILSNYLEKNLSNENILNSFYGILNELKGTYAISFILENQNKLFFARKDSPLVLGISDKGNFLSSDITSFFNKTKKVVYLEDGDYGYISGNNFEIYNAGKIVHRETKMIDWDIEKASKGDFEHFMLKEISEQAEVVTNIVNQDMSNIENIINKIKNKKIYIVACGTSYNAGLASSYEFLKNNKLVTVVQAHEFKKYHKFIDKETVILAISQSGETIDLLIANNISKLNLKDSIISLNEIIRNIFYLTSNSARKYTKELAQILKYSSSLFTIGRGRDYATAMEAALKIKEVSYIHAEGFAGGEIKHGPIALIEKNSPCIVFVPNNNPEEILSNAQELKARGGFIIGISEKNHEVFDYWIKVLGNDKYSPILKAIPCQILAYYLAVLKGYDPDKPRNLAKSVTVK